MLTPGLPLRSASDTTTPPAWSPGVAVAGTDTVNGTSTVLPAGMVTTGPANLIQVPMSVGLRLAGSRSKAPLGWLNASVPYTANGTVTLDMLVTRTRSVIVPPGGDCITKCRRLSGLPVGPAGRTAQILEPSSGGAGLSTTARATDAVVVPAGTGMPG